MSLSRRASAELAGTALLVAAVVGSGIAAARLSPHDGGLRLLESALATGLALGALLAVAAVAWWYPHAAPPAADVVAHHDPEVISR